MHAEQLSWSEGSGWVSGNSGAQAAGLVRSFVTRQAPACGVRYRALPPNFPGVHLLGRSIGGRP